MEEGVVVVELVVEVPVDGFLLEDGRRGQPLAVILGVGQGPGSVRSALLGLLPGNALLEERVSDVLAGRLARPV